MIMVYEYGQLTWTLTFDPKKIKNPRDIFNFEKKSRDLQLKQVPPQFGGFCLDF